jgi:hypothetical protein
VQLLTDDAGERAGSWVIAFQAPNNGNGASSIKAQQAKHFVQCSPSLLAFCFIRIFSLLLRFRSTLGKGV